MSRDRAEATKATVAGLRRSEERNPAATGSASVKVVACRLDSPRHEHILVKPFAASRVRASMEA
jgi:hypothetical protein